MTIKDSYSIYQVREGEATRGIRFEPLERLKAAGTQVDRRNYDLVYSTPLEPVDGLVSRTLEALYQKFNLDPPKDFAGHSMSVSDIVVLRTGEGATAHYVDSFGFADVPEFLDGLYHYYAHHRLDIGTFPKTEHGPVALAPYDKRTWVEGKMFQAWGMLTYTGPLTLAQIRDFELRAAPDNPDYYQLPPRQLDIQLQIIGAYEQASGMREQGRLTWFHPDFGHFLATARATPEKIAERYAKVEAHNMRSRARPTIAEQLKQGGDPPGQSPEKKSCPKDRGDR